MASFANKFSRLQVHYPYVTKKVTRTVSGNDPTTILEVNALYGGNLCNVHTDKVSCTIRITIDDTVVFEGALVNGYLTHDDSIMVDTVDYTDWSYAWCFRRKLLVEAIGGDGTTVQVAYQLWR